MKGLMKIAPNSVCIKTCGKLSTAVHVATSEMGKPYHVSTKGLQNPFHPIEFELENNSGPFG
jgi:uncharacterized protein YjhX (UPF0386 family)